MKLGRSRVEGLAEVIRDQGRIELLNMNLQIDRILGIRVMLDHQPIINRFRSRLRKTDRVSRMSWRRTRKTTQKVMRISEGEPRLIS